MGTTSSGLITSKKPICFRASGSPTVSVTMREKPNGRTVLERMPCSAPSIAITFDRPTSPALAAA